VRRLFRPHEFVIFFYLLYCCGVAAVRPIAPSIRHTAWVLNLTILAAYALLAYADSFRRTKLLGALRDWFPMVLLLLAYREMGWFALPHHSTALEHGWVVWDHLFLDEWHVRSLIELLGPVLPSVLELSYSLVYTVAPSSLAALYLLGNWRNAEELLFPAMCSILGCYILFPFFPSEPPRTVFPEVDLPVRTIFRDFNRWLLGNWGIHTSVFPSAHVAGAFGFALGLRRLLPRHRWLTRSAVVMASLIATATVYGRYHYLVDALAGLALALLAIRATEYVYHKPERSSSDFAK
jgi:membrane-associated phospholipid phosphatase